MNVSELNNMLMYMLAAIVPLLIIVVIYEKAV